MKTASWRMVSGVRSCVALDFDRFVVLPAVHERRNTMLRRGRCVGPVCEAVQDWFGSSVGIEEENGKDRKEIPLQA